MTTSEYWQERAIYRVVATEIQGVAIMNDVIPLYDQALKNINKDIKKVYEIYSKETGIDTSKLRGVMSGVDRNRFVREVEKKLAYLGLKVDDVYTQRFIMKMSRLEATKQQIYWEIQKIAPQEVLAQTKGYKQIIRSSYTSAKTDIRESMGTLGSFATIDPKTTNQILNTKWENKNYVDRTGKNVTLLADRLRNIVGGGLISGTSSQKMAQQIREQVDIGVYKSMRLIRTETNYFLNQTELKTYKEEGIKYYRYEATLDGRTSRVCQTLNGKIFKTKSAEVGVNYPPMHPSCRSTTVVVFGDELESE